MQEGTWSLSRCAGQTDICITATPVVTKGTGSVIGHGLHVVGYGCGRAIPAGSTRCSGQTKPPSLTL
jgi:hypothetical protein